MANAIEDFVASAKNAGVPRDQLERFVSFAYTPLPWQLGFHAVARQCDESDGPVWVGVGGARGPGKSHGVFAQVSLDDCQRVPDLKCLFIRQTGLSARESFEDLIQKVLRAKIHYTYNRSDNSLTFRNGSRVLLGGFKDERDIDKYVGIEYDLIAVEELNQLQGERVNKLLGSLRTSKQGWRPRLYASFNPGGKGHTSVKKMFVEPFRVGAETKTRFIPSTYKQNPYLNTEYIQYLEGLEGNLGKAWRDGDFDVFEGQFFNEWNSAKHVVEPFKVPDSWKRIRGIDHGRAKPTACLWGAIDYDGNIWWYREHYTREEDLGTPNNDADVNAQKICKLSEGEVFVYNVLDSACFSNTGTGETIAEIYERNGVMCSPSPKSRLAGWALFHEYLRLDPGGNPKMRFFRNCYNTIRTIPSLIHDERHPEDLDTDGEDHAEDAISYALQALHESKSPPEKDPLQKQLEAFQKKFSVTPQNLNKFYSRR